MAKYRKKPVVIEAFQFTGNNLDGPICRDPGENQPAYIETGEVRLMISPGAWVIRRADGVYTACKPDMFPILYEPEPVEATP